MSTEPSALAVVQEVFRCFAEHDVPGLVALLDEDVEWRFCQLSGQKHNIL